MVHATDTDIFTLAISSKYSDHELWIAFGHKGIFRCIAIHVIGEELDPLKSSGLHFLHTISGRDIVLTLLQ